MSTNLIQDGTIFDLSMATRHTLKFMIQQSSPPHNGSPHSYTDSFGATTNMYPWGIETSQAMGDKNNIMGYLTAYVFPVSDTTYLYGYIIGELLDPVTRRMADPHWGPQIIPLIKQHWPTTFAMFQAGVGMPDAYGLIRVRTDCASWFFGGVLATRTVGMVDLDEELIVQIREVAFHVLGDALGWPTNLPGLTDVFAGPDRTQQRMNLTKDLLDTIKNGLELANKFMK